MKKLFLFTVMLFLLSACDPTKASQIEAQAKMVQAQGEADAARINAETNREWYARASESLGLTPFIIMIVVLTGIVAWSGAVIILAAFNRQPDQIVTRRSGPVDVHWNTVTDSILAVNMVSGKVQRLDPNGGGVSGQLPQSQRLDPNGRGVSGQLPQSGYSGERMVPFNGSQIDLSGLERELARNLLRAYREWQARRDYGSEVEFDYLANKALDSKRKQLR